MAKWSSEGLEIHTRSVEKVLVPLVAQVSILVNNGVKEGSDSVFLKNILPNLEVAVCKFTSIGHEMGNTNTDIRDDMLDACDTTNKACNSIVSVLNNDTTGNLDKESLAESSRLLLSAITRILILADKTAVKKMVASANKVDARLRELENVSNFTEFVHAFSQFGGHMVELAYISGERQNDLKDELQCAEVCASRAILEKSTMMLLTTCKTCLRHPDSPLALGNRNAVFKNMRNAMKVLKSIVQDNKYPDKNLSRGIGIDLKELKESIENAVNSDGDYNAIDNLLERLDNISIDMDDVINVENITASKKANIKMSISTAKDLQKQLRSYLIGGKVVGALNGLLNVLHKISEATEEMMTELAGASSEQVADVLSHLPYKESLHNLKSTSLQGELQEVEEIGATLKTQLQTVLAVSNLVKNVSVNEACIITASRLEENLAELLPQLIDAGKMLAAHPLSKITQENLEVFIDVWDTQVDELYALLRNVTQTNAEHEST